MRGEPISGNSKLRVLVLGGYGGTGRVLCRYLLQETAVDVIIAGRRVNKAEALAGELKRQYPSGRISVCRADAADPGNLRLAFRDADLVLVAATTGEWARQIAEAAIEAGIDCLDIYFRQDVYPVLEKLAQRITRAGRCFITQSGFHPGLPSAFIRQGAGYFDRYDKAVIGMAMNARLEEPESVYELVDLVSDYRAEVFKEGKWRRGTYRDCLKLDFGSRFGVRSCMPMELVEVRPLPGMLGLRETEVFAAGFNWLVDYILFPVMILSHRIKKGSLRRFWAKALIRGINNFSGGEPGVAFLLQAEGEKDGRLRTVRIMAEHGSAYDFTVIPVIACLKQYLDGSIRRPGLWLMGHLVDTDRLFADMKKMGVDIQIRVPD